MCVCVYTYAYIAYDVHLQLTARFFIGDLPFAQHVAAQAPGTLLLRAVALVWLGHGAVIRSSYV